MRNASLRMKLIIASGTLLAILIVVAIVGLHSVVKLDHMADAVDRETEEKESSLYIMEAVIKESSGTRGYLLTDQQRMLERAEDGRREWQDVIAKLAPTVQSDESKQSLATVQHSYDAFHAIVDKEIALHREHRDKESLALTISDEEPALNAIDKATDDFASIVEKEKKQIQRDQDTEVAQSKTLVTGLALAGIVVGFLVSFLIARSILGSLGRMLVLIQEIANKNLAVEDMQITSEDEIGKAGIALNGMKNSLHEVIQQIAETAQHVASASEELSATSQQISANSEETSAQASTVSQATHQVSQNLQSVSTGADEMTSTIQSIATNAHEAATVASNAVQTAHGANANVAKLGASSAEIGEVIKVITSIAQQTNLLALNATIEAARAGEAGKGFAVVANEVKELAKQTAKATEDISRKITAIQTDTQGAVEAIGTISGVISQINDISGTIATAVEEQSATTNEMTRNVADAAKGSGEITQNIEGVAEAARGTSSSAQESQKAANELAEMAAQLHSLVGQFKLDGTTRAAARHDVHESGKSMAAPAGR